MGCHTSQFKTSVGKNSAKENHGTRIKKKTHEVWYLFSILLFGKKLLILGQSISVFNNFTESWNLSQKKNYIKGNEQNIYFYMKLYRIPNTFQLPLQNIIPYLKEIESWKIKHIHKENTKEKRDSGQNNCNKNIQCRFKKTDNILHTQTPPQNTQKTPTANLVSVRIESFAKITFSVNFPFTMQFQWLPFSISHFPDSEAREPPNLQLLWPE